MISVSISARPRIFAERKPPKTPQDLTEHDCINLRLPTHGGLYAWEFEKSGRKRQSAEEKNVLNIGRL
jgi:hypothetical protein